MKISNKEKIMLCILGIIIIGFAYYQFVYTVQISKIQEKTKQESELKQKYTTAMNTINSIEDKKSDVKILRAKIGEESIPFYPIISEEHIILELDTLLKDSGLEGGIKFNPIVSDSVEGVETKSDILAESSLQGIADEYNSINGNADVNNSSASNSANTSSNNKASTTNNANSNSTKNSKINDKDKKKNTVQYVKAEINFTGSYEGLNKLLNTIGKNQKKIVVNSIKINEDTIDSVQGVINLEIYSIPKIEDELVSYLKWDLNNAYGKSMPFGSGAASSVETGKSQESTEPSDFIASVKPTASDLPTIMMGKSNDDLRTSYVYADSNSEEKVEMVLTQDGDKYYYKYKTSKGTFPANYESYGAEFVPTSDNIVLDILSRSRLDANDNSEIRLKIVNKTDKLVKVNISSDDLNNPRVSIEGDLSNISVNNK